MAKKKIYKHHQRTTIAQALTDAQTRELVLGSDERQVAIPFSDGKQLVLNPNYDVSAFGAVGDGSTDDAAIILSVFNLIRTKGKGTIWFPPGKTFMVSYGFHVPPKCTIRLNGSTIKATTTFGQGTIPSGAFGSARRGA